MVTLLERYVAGACRSVWDDLVALGPAVYEPRWRAEAEAVAAETMDRVASNVATIVGRLNRMGYRFAEPYLECERIRSAPDRARLRAKLIAEGYDAPFLHQSEPVQSEPDQFAYAWEPRRGADGERIERAERIVGPLPVSLRALWSVVGEVGLQGSFRSWAPSAFVFEDELPWPRAGLYSGPLNVADERMVFNFCDRGTDHIRDRYREDDGRFRVCLGADGDHGAGFSGGNHSVLVPQRVADPVLEGVHHHDGIRLVEYLRLCFDWGGFPGFAVKDTTPAEIDVLREGLLPI